MTVVKHIVSPCDADALAWESQSSARPEIGISLASGSDYYYSAANIFATTGAKSAWIRWTPDAASPAGTRCVFDCNSFGGSSGCAIITEANPFPGATDGRLLGWANNYAPNPSQSVKILTPHEYGQSRRIRTSMVWLGSDGNFHFAEGGYEVGVGGASAFTNFNTANRLAINSRAILGTLPYGAMTVFELQFSTLQPTAADVLAIAKAPVGTQWSGATHLWKASPSWSVGASAPSSWADSIGAVALTKAGTTSTIARNARGMYLGAPSIQIMGDSIAAGRQSGGGLGNGWRRTMQQDLASNGYVCAIGGVNASSASTPDFDAQHRALAGQGLGVPAGALPTRLSTIATDRGLDAPASGITILAYGANDLPYRVGILAQSTTDARDSFFADITTALDSIRGVRSGPIIVWNVLKQATGASSANDRAAIAAANAGLAAHLAARADPLLSMFDAESVITPTQADADDTNVLLDGVHPTPASYAALGAAMARHIMRVV